jgi:hypothetical protein
MLTVCLEETALQWVMFDIDKLSLPLLGFDNPLPELEPSIVCDAIIAKHLPELLGTSYHFQLSSTSGWQNPFPAEVFHYPPKNFRRKYTISVHLWYWLDRSMTNIECKAFARFVNTRERQTILDPALYKPN